MKFPQLPKLIKALWARRESVAEVDPCLQGIAEGLNRLLVAPGPMILQDADELEEALEALRVATYRLETDAPTSADITVGHVQNARLEASGKILI